MSALRFCLAFITAFVLFSCGHSFAANCGSGKILIEDSFAKLSPVWGITQDADIKPGPNGLEVRRAKNVALVSLNQSGFYGDYEVCMTVKAVSKCSNPADLAKCEISSYFGIQFWGSNLANLYVIEVAPNTSNFAVYRLQNGKYLNPVLWTALPNGALAKMSSDFVDLSVAVKGNHMTAKVNGVVALEFDGLPPDGGSLFGFEVGTYGTSTETGSITVKKIELRELQ